MIISRSMHTSMLDFISIEQVRFYEKFQNDTIIIFFFVILKNIVLFLEFKMLRVICVLISIE